ncbi:hypothetical protein BT93_H1655 [Corymbia citriodora subsp. variegata]|nr:hypothetical protein BT93_H1655 [Corymbia citriodora subsp. variegata]
MKSLFAESSGTLAYAVAESFNEDIVIEILLRLPAKSLMRFKCVSKWWQSLISDPGFAKSHLQRLKAGDIISSQRIFKTGPFEIINYEVLDGSDDGGVVVKSQEPRMDAYTWYAEHVGSCDGLVCLSVLGRFVLYNPTTGERRNLPSSDLFRLPEIFHGFGYDSRSDDYKIVQCKGTDQWQGGSMIWEMAIFSLKSGSWKMTQVRRRHLYGIEQAGVYWNGALHWCSIDHSKMPAEAVILSFNLSEEKFQQVLPVPELDGGINFKGLGIHGANLFMYHGSYTHCFQAWIRSEYGKGGSWTKLFSISTRGIPPGYNHTQIIPVVYTRSGKIVFQLNASRMILFDPEDNTYKDYPIQNYSNIYSATYVETLVSPYLGCEPSKI